MNMSDHALFASLAGFLTALALGIVVLIGVGIFVQLRQQSSRRKKKEPPVKDIDPHR